MSACKHKWEPCEFLGGSLRVGAGVEILEFGGALRNSCVVRVSRFVCTSCGKFFEPDYTKATAPKSIPVKVQGRYHGDSKD